MSSARRAYVLSDLHLGPGGPLTTFHEAERLAGLFDHWRWSRQRFELVLAGDIFDFLQVDGYDGFSASQASARFETIAKAPGTERVLDALRVVSGCAGVELTILAGNHDPELLVDDVRDALAARIGRAPDTIRWADDTPLVERAGPHPRVWGRALAPAGADGDSARSAWVVHGDRWDPSNYVDRDAVRVAARDDRPVQLPIGSHLVFEVLSKLKPDHRWVDELKPELSAVLPLLLAIAPGLTMKYLAKHCDVAAPLLVSRLKAWRRKGPLFEPAPPPAPDPVGALVAAFRAELGEVPDDEVDRLLAVLEVHLEHDEAPPGGGDLMAAPRGAVGFLVRTWLRAVRATDRFGRLDGEDSIADGARRYLPPDLGALIAGHTHGARIRADLTPPYFNSGTWAPVRTVPPGDLASWLGELTAPDAARVPSPGTFVRVELGDGTPRVAVETWP